MIRYERADAEHFDSLSQFFTTQAFFHQLFRSFSCGFDQVLVPFVSQFNHVCRDIFVFRRLRPGQRRSS